jgi:hypothetical protein
MANYSAADISLVVILVLIAFADVAVFVKCQTFKAPTSLFISVCLFVDLILRIVELLVDQHNLAKNNPKNLKLFELEHDFTQFLFCSVALALMTQWCWIY